MNYSQCPRCSTPVTPEMPVCPNCGCQLKPPTQPTPSWQAHKPAGGNGNTVVIVLLTLLIVLIAAIGAYFIFFNEEKKADATPTEKQRDTIVVKEIEVVKEKVVAAEPTTPTASSSVTYPDGFEYLGNSYITETDIAQYDKRGRRFLRNVIYAAHGYIFHSKDLREHFSQFSWYQPRYSDVTNQLNKYEIYNVNYIKRHE